MTFVKTKLLIERMKPGEVAEIMLKGIEPLSNVPRSVAELGYEIMANERQPGEPEHGKHKIKIRKPG